MPRWTQVAYIYQGNKLGIDQRRVIWMTKIDMAASSYMPPWTYTVLGRRWFRVDEKKRRLWFSQSHRYKVHNNMVAVRWLFFFCHRAATFSLFFYLNRQSSQKCHGHTPFRQNNKLKSHQSVRFQIFWRKPRGNASSRLSIGLWLFIVAISAITPKSSAVPPQFPC